MAANPIMMVPYEWILEDVSEDPMIISSQMILFREQQVFRVGLKNQIAAAERNPSLFLVAINLNKIGIRVRNVAYSTRGSDVFQVMVPQDGNNDGTLQLFSINLTERVVGNCTFLFRIHIEGTVTEFAYHLADRLMKETLWASVIENRHWADIEVFVKDRRFTAHKAILAARSPVFASAFVRNEPGITCSHVVRCDDVEPSSMEQFLHFLYTGEPVSSILDNEDLLKLANRYQIATLTNLCNGAQMQMDAHQMLFSVANLHEEVAAQPQQALNHIVR